MKYVRQTAQNRWQAHLTIGIGLSDCPRTKGIDVSLGTFASEKAAYEFAVKAKEEIKNFDSYVKQREVITKLRESHYDRENRIIFCCGTKILSKWKFCPICGVQHREHY